MGAAPRIGNDAECSRPYAGNSEYPTVLMRVTTLRVAARVVTIRSVRTISRKDSGFEMVQCRRRAGESSETKRRPSHSFYR